MPLGEPNSRRNKSSGGSLLGPSDEYRLPKGTTGIRQSLLGEFSTSAPKFDFDKGKLRWGGNWVHWKGIGRYADLLPLGPPFYSYQAVWDKPGFSPECKSELIRFLLVLQLWEDTPGKKIITPAEVWARSLTFGPAFAEECKDLFDLTWREKDQDSYNFSFPARFLPRWETSVDDLVLSQIHTEGDEDELDRFRATIRQILEESKIHSGEPNFPSDSEILYERTSTTSFDKNTLRTAPQWEMSLGRPTFEDKELRAKRCVVPVYPGGIRDTVIADISANHSIRWIERSMRQILEFVPESAVTLRSVTFEKRLKDVVYYKGWHVLRDIKKCGLTYNVKDLFPIVREELIDVYGEARFERLRLFDDMQYLDDDGEWKIANRGYFLGMANHVVTLCNIAISRMCIEMIPTDLYPLEYRAILGNDDADVAFSSKKAAETYLNIEHDVQLHLGNLTNMKKSVIKPWGLFYETYSKEGWQDKEALVCNAIACAYLAPDIRTAKGYIASQSQRFQSPWARSKLRELVLWWGAEFFTPAIEYNIHREIGGWLNTTSLGLKTTLQDLDRLADKYPYRLIEFAYKTCNDYLRAPKPLYKHKGYVDNHIYNGVARKSHDRLQIYTLAEEDLRDYYKRLTTFQRNHLLREENFNKRSRAYKTSNDLEEMQRLILSHEPWYAIPRSMLTGAKDTLGDHLCLTQSELIHDNFNSLMLSMEHARLYGEYADLEPDLEDIRWDPEVPSSTLKLRMKVDLYTMYELSQFSNSGALPLFEYMLRTEEDRAPTVKSLGRHRIATYGGTSGTDMRPILLARRKFLPEKEEVVLFEGDDQDYWSDPEEGDMQLPETHYESLEAAISSGEIADIMAIYDFGKTEQEILDEIFVSRLPTPTPPDPAPNEHVQNMEEVDDLLNLAHQMASGRGDYGSLLAEFGDPFREEGNDQSSESEVSVDFDMFG